MKIGIMQPYFLPYIGYFQLMNKVDEFVVYDNIEYTKKGWINRNRILMNGRDAYVSLPLKKASDYSQIRDRVLAESWPSERISLLNKISSAYQKAPHYASVYPVIEEIVKFEDANLFAFIFHSLEQIKAYLAISTPLVVSSTLPIDHKLKAADKVLAICQARGADIYINPIGGTELYDENEFAAQNIDLRFLKTSTIKYKQFDDNFVPLLSILDVMMFNTKDTITEYLTSRYTLI